MASSFSNDSLDQWCHSIEGWGTPSNSFYHSIHWGSDSNSSIYGEWRVKGWTTEILTGRTPYLSGNGYYPNEWVWESEGHFEEWRRSLFVLYWSMTLDSFSIICRPSRRVKRNPFPSWMNASRISWRRFLITMLYVDLYCRGHPYRRSWKSTCTSQREEKKPALFLLNLLLCVLWFLVNPQHKIPFKSQRIWWKRKMKRRRLLKKRRRSK